MSSNKYNQNVGRRINTNWRVNLAPDQRYANENASPRSSASQPSNSIGFKSTSPAPRQILGIAAFQGQKRKQEEEEGQDEDEGSPSGNRKHRRLVQKGKAMDETQEVVVERKVTSRIVSRAALKRERRIQAAALDREMFIRDICFHENASKHKRSAASIANIKRRAPPIPQEVKYLPPIAQFIDPVKPQLRMDFHAKCYAQRAAGQDRTWQPYATLFPGQFWSCHKPLQHPIGFQGSTTGGMLMQPPAEYAPWPVNAKTATVYIYGLVAWTKNGEDAWGTVPVCLLQPLHEDFLNCDKTFLLDQRYGNEVAWSIVLLGCVNGVTKASASSLQVTTDARIGAITSAPDETVYWVGNFTKLAEVTRLEPDEILDWMASSPSSELPTIGKELLSALDRRCTAHWLRGTYLPQLFGAACINLKPSTSSLRHAEIVITEPERESPARDWCKGLETDGDYKLDLMRHFIHITRGVHAILHLGSKSEHTTYQYKVERLVDSESLGRSIIRTGLDARVGMNDGSVRMAGRESIVRANIGKWPHKRYSDNTDKWLPDMAERLLAYIAREVDNDLEGGHRWRATLDAWRIVHPDIAQEELISSTDLERCLRTISAEEEAELAGSLSALGIHLDQVGLAWHRFAMCDFRTKAEFPERDLMVAFVEVAFSHAGRDFCKAGLSALDIPRLDGAQRPNNEDRIQCVNILNNPTHMTIAMGKLGLLDGPLTADMDTTIGIGPSQYLSMEKRRVQRVESVLGARIIHAGIIDAMYDLDKEFVPLAKVMSAVQVLRPRFQTT